VVALRLAFIFVFPKLTVLHSVALVKPGETHGGVPSVDILLDTGNLEGLITPTFWVLSIPFTLHASHRSTHTSFAGLAVEGVPLSDEDHGS
jgi:hypothetical protein